MQTLDTIPATFAKGQRVSFPAPEWTGWVRLTGTVAVAESDSRGFISIRPDGACWSQEWHDPETLILDGPRIPMDRPIEPPDRGGWCAAPRPQERPMSVATVRVIADPSTLDTQLNQAINVIEAEGHSIMDVHAPILIDAGRVLVLVVYVRKDGR